MNEKLMAAFGFSADDLAHNRRGELSPAQQERVKKNTGKNKGIFAILGIIALTIAIFLSLPLLQSMSFAGTSPLKLFGIAALLAVSLLFFSCLFEKSTVEIGQVEGNVQFISRESMIDDDGTQIAQTSFYIVIGKEEFAIKSEQYDAFMQGHRYRVYSAEKALFLSGILSVEYLGE